MKYSYNLFNPLDYLRLLFLAFFNFSVFPKPMERAKQIILIIQGIVTVIVINAVVGWLTDWGGDWELFIFRVLVGVLIGVTVGMRMRIDFLSMNPYGVAVVVPVCVVVGVAGGVAGGMAEGVAVGVVVGAMNIATYKFSPILGVPIIMIKSVVFGVVGGVLFCTTVRVMNNLSGIWIWASSLGFVLFGGSVMLLAADIAADIAVEIIFKNENYSAKYNIWSGFALLTLLSLGAGYFFEFLATWLPSLGEGHPLWIAMLFFLSISRLPLWPIEAIIGLIGYTYLTHSHNDPKKLFNSIHVWYFDHHTLLPLPYESHVLCRLAEQDWNKGIQETIRIALSSSQILESIKALSSFAQTDPYSVQFHISSAIGTINRNSLLQNIFFYKQPEKITRVQSACQILVDLRKKFEAKWVEINIKEERLYRLLFTPLKRVIFLPLETVMDELIHAIDEMKLADILAGEGGIKYGEEMTALYSGILTALNCLELSQIANFHVPALPSDAQFLFPKRLLDTLKKMDEIARTIAAFNQASSQVTRQRELLEANEKLVTLREKLIFLEHLSEKFPQPADPLLSMVIAHWQRLLAAGGGELARSYSLEPVSNPYVIANPVIGDLFVGREDKLNRLEELWGGTGQKPSVVLFGHRRMGKSSILNNLGSRFGANTITVDFNMQREGIVANTGELLYNLTMAIYDTLPPSMQKKLEHGEPDEEQFTNHNPHTAFNRFLKRLDRIREHTRFIVTVDEFELLEDLIDKGKADPKLLDHWRSLIQTYPWFVMALAGLHTLREMTHDYWHPLYSSVIAEPVSFLSPGAARNLIIQPTPEFPLDYDADAIERIIAITNGQPYLIQLICHGLVTRFNRQTFEQGVERERRFSIKDVEAVINAPEFFRDGNAYFTGVWIQAEKSEPLEQTKVLRTMSQSEHGMTVEQIAGHMKLPNEKIENALETLTRHDVVIQKDGLWQLTVELMRRWVAQKQGEEL